MIFILGLTLDFHCYPIFGGEILLVLVAIVWMLGVCCLTCVFSFVGQGLEVFFGLPVCFFKIPSWEFCV